jgi:hypothetical protein
MSDWEKHWPVEEPPEGFADRVVAAASGRRRPLVPALIAVAAVAAAAIVLVAYDTGVSRGSRTPLARESLAIGARGTAVAEPGAELSWLVQGGRADVDQHAGDVFYRVERGGPFVVRTPAADVRVTGTSFRVEVDMKRTLLPMAAGAAISATVLVTVYEGKVILANERGQTWLAAGQQASVRAGEPPSEARDNAQSAAAAAARADLSAPPGQATREELLARDRAQQVELERLKSRVAELESHGAAGARADNKPRPFYDPSPDELKKLADDCKLKWDAPSLSQRSNGVDSRATSELGLSEQERADIIRINTDFKTRVIAQLRALYLEATGDKDGAAELTADAMVHDLYERSREDDLKTAFALISRERAGLAAPGESSTAPAVERMQRLLVSLGDSYEHDLGAAIGPDRARQLRDLNGGWGNRNSSSFGCPGSN